MWSLWEIVMAIQSSNTAPCKVGKEGWREGENTQRRTKRRMKRRASKRMENLFTQPLNPGRRLEDTFFTYLIALTPHGRSHKSHTRPQPTRIILHHH